MQSLVLGTAQWGDAYGITNREGRLSDRTVTEIAEQALAWGVAEVDTAVAYGDAEERLRPWAGRFAITTKVRGADARPVPEQLRASLARLGVSSVRCALVHDWAALGPGEQVQVAAGLSEARDLGLVSVIGVSGYDDRDLDTALESFDVLGAVQCPVNALDRRLDGTPTLARLLATGVEVQARSVFLQGLLAGPTTFGRGAHPDVARFHQECARAGLSSLEGALAWVRGRSWVDRIVVGVTSAAELADVIAALRGGASPPDFTPSSDWGLLDPRSWA